jgi:hypothetical protein
MPNNIANLCIQQQQLEKQIKETRDTTTSLLETLTIKFDQILQILMEIRDKEFSINSDGIPRERLIEKTPKEVMPFTPSINTSNGKIQAKDVEKRRKNKDLSDSVDKLSKVSS